MVLDSVQIAAMVRARLRTVMRAGRFRWLVIGWVAVREAIRHNQVNHVLRRKPLKLPQRGGARGKRQFEGGCSLWRPNPANRCTWLRVRSDPQPYKKIIAAGRCLCAQNA